NFLRVTNLCIAIQVADILVMRQAVLEAERSDLLSVCFILGFHGQNAGNCVAELNIKFFHWSELLKMFYNYGWLRGFCLTYPRRPPPVLPGVSLCFGIVERVN